MLKIRGARTLFWLKTADPNIQVKFGWHTLIVVPSTVAFRLMADDHLFGLNGRHDIRDCAIEKKH